MSDPAATAQRQQNQRQGLIVTIVSLPFRLFGVLVASLFLSILIECVGIHFFWPEQGWRHAADMLDYELNQLSENFTHSAVVQEPGRTARWLVESAYEWIFVRSGLADWMQESSEQASARPPFSAAARSICSLSPTLLQSRNGMPCTRRRATPPSG